MKLMCIGDSITFGYGVHPSKKWTRLTEEMSGWHIINKGVCGDTTGGMLVRLNALLTDKSKPLQDQYVFIMGGCNDIFYSGSDIVARTNIATALQYLLAAGAKPVTGIPMPLGDEARRSIWSSAVDFSSAGKLLAAYSSWLDRFLETLPDVRVIDFRPVFTDEHGMPRNELYLDGIHPNADGHREMAAAVCAVLAELDGGHSGE